MGNKSNKNYFIGNVENTGNIIDIKNGKTVSEIKDLLKNQGIKTIDVICKKDGICKSEVMANGQYIICNQKYLPDLFNNINIVEVTYKNEQ